MRVMSATHALQQQLPWPIGFVYHQPTRAQRRDGWRAARAMRAVTPLGRLIRTAAETGGSSWEAVAAAAGVTVDDALDVGAGDRGRASACAANALAIWAGW